MTAALASVAVTSTVMAMTTTGLAFSSASASAATLGQSWYAQAPYVMPTDNNPPDLPAVMSATGEKAFMLAFVLADGSSCDAAWGGTSPVSSDTAVAGVIAGVRAAGGDVSVSVGGYGGTKLGQVCTTPTTTAAAYQAVIDKYSLKAMDFDLEEPEYENTTAVSNEIGAEQILQRDNPGIYLSITVPGTTSGTGYFGQNVLNTAKGLGFTPDNYSIMPFDGGFNGAASQQSALTAFNGLLTTTFGWSAPTAWAHEGISQMNGRSDTGEIFTQADFASNLSFAQSKGLGRYTFWSVNRDRQCADGADSTTSGTCSSVVQNAWDFTKDDVQFAGGGGGGIGGGATAGASGPVRSALAGKCLDVNTGSSANGTAVQLWDCNGTGAQVWTAYSDGTLRALGKCLDATGAGTGNGTKLEIWDCNGGGNQVWQISNGGYRNPASGRYLDDPGATTSNGTQLELWDGNGTNAQLWSAPGAAAAGGGGGTSSCSGLAAYSATAVYTDGMTVSYNGHKWTAKWWTQGEAPSTAGSGVWADNGGC